MNELSFCVVKNVIIAKETVAAKVVRNVVPLLHKWLLIEMIAHADGSTDYEVHF